MKKLSRYLMGTLVFALVIFSVGFIAGEVIMKKKIDIIKQRIPNQWWQGGWNEEPELQTIISQFPQDISQSAQAQYYIASQYYANRDHKKAIQEYKKLINNYPNAWLECQKAQFEIAQINLYRLNEPSTAILEYQKVINDYPESYIKAIAQMMIGRAYRRMKDYNNAFLEYGKVIQLYPSCRTEVTETHLDLADMSIEQAFTAGIDDTQKQQYLKEAISSCKKAYKLCPFDQVELMERSLDGVYRAFRCLDMNLARANQFIKFQKYGKAGMDGIEGTADDLTDPLEGLEI